MGQVLNLSRGSVFVGGGAVLSQAPTSGASNGPARMFVDLSLTDVLFEPLAAKQNVRAVAAARDSAFNDVQLQVVVAYLDLSRAQSLMAIAIESETNASELVRLTMAQEEADVGLRADVERSKAELALRQRRTLESHELMRVASARLTRLLSLDPCVTLVAQENRPFPIEIWSEQFVLGELISQAIAARPERSEALARIQETCRRQQQESVRPWLPNLHLGYSWGTFAGGNGSFIGNNGLRSDFDILAVWQVRNAGAGTQAVRAEAASQHRQACLMENAVRDQITADVAAAYHRVDARRLQLDVTRRQVEAAAAALPLNFKGIVGRQLRAIEAQQAIRNLDVAFREHLDAIIGFNQAQFQLLHAVGTPPHADFIEFENRDPRG